MWCDLPTHGSLLLWKIYSAEYMRRLCAIGRNGVSMLSMNEAAQKIGFQTVCGKMTIEALRKQSLFPCILHWKQEHFVVLYDVKKRHNGKYIYHIADPGKSLMKIEEETFQKAWTGKKEEDGIGKGKIVEIGTHQELVKTKKTYYNLVKNQLELEE